MHIHNTFLRVHVRSRTQDETKIITNKLNKINDKIIIIIIMHSIEGSYFLARK